jgi:hypothetical protein
LRSADGRRASPPATFRAGCRIRVLRTRPTWVMTAGLTSMRSIAASRSRMNRPEERDLSLHTSIRATRVSASTPRGSAHSGHAGQRIQATRVSASPPHTRTHAQTTSTVQFATAKPRPPQAARQSVPRGPTGSQRTDEQAQAAAAVQRRLHLKFSICRGLAPAGAACLTRAFAHFTMWSSSIAPTTPFRVST